MLALTQCIHCQIAYSVYRPAMQITSVNIWLSHWLDASPINGKLGFWQLHTIRATHLGNSCILSRGELVASIITLQNDWIHSENLEIREILKNNFVVLLFVTRLTEFHSGHSPPMFRRVIQTNGRRHMPLVVPSVGTCQWKKVRQILKYPFNDILFTAASDCIKTHFLQFLKTF